MTSDDNTVNIEARPRYHHGDLRSALVAEGLRQLASGDAAGLSLRALARAAGVSATAVYRHFADKDALLRALCGEGDRMLEQASRHAQAAAGEGKAGFLATGRAYVRFALANPALFRLMMSRMPAGGSAVGPPDSRSHGGFALLRENIARIGPPNLPEAERRVLALRSWSLVHGLAMLMLDGLVPADDALVDAVITAPF